MRKTHRILSVALLAGTVALVGCHDDKKPDQADATTAPAAEPMPSPVVSAPPPAPAPAPAPVVEAPPMAPPPPAKVSSTKPSHDHKTAHAGGIYVVEKGDTLYRIARKVYKDADANKMVKAIIKANPGIDPDKITVGQKIKLP